MRHSKRDYLTQQDIKLAMKGLNLIGNEERIFGYPSNWPVQYQKL